MKSIAIDALAIQNPYFTGPLSLPLGQFQWRVNGSQWQLPLLNCP
jgi:hypothetical protein